MTFQINPTNELREICPNSKVVVMTADNNKPQSGEGLIKKLTYSWSLWLGQYRITLEFIAMVLVLFTLLRVILVFTYVDWNSVATHELIQLSIIGLRFDLLVTFLYVMPQIIRHTFFYKTPSVSRLNRTFLHFEILFTVLFIPFLCVAEFLFFDEFQSRLNYIAFEYLVYPHEVFGNIWESYPIVLLFFGIFITAGSLFVIIRKRAQNVVDIPIPKSRRYGIFFMVVFTISILWSTISMSSTKYSQNRIVNQCSGNGLYSFVFYAWSCGFDYDEFYLTIDREEANQRVQQRIITSNDHLHEFSLNPVDRTVTVHRIQRDWNVVVILEESLGSDFVGILGDDRGLTPFFDKLSAEGILFDNFYATGNRTARALEAVLTSMPPIPTESILKRDHSDNVYTLAHVLAARGYNRVFIEGGHGIFDGMRSFMMSNGFERFIELKDYEAPTFTTAWGACDEDIFNRSLIECDDLSKRNNPFFMVVLTNSNHQPFTYPSGRIDLPSEAKNRTHAVKYSDWALGNFFQKAKLHEFYKNTLFVVMGDHGARVYGSQLFPMKSYRIPVLMILPSGNGGGIRCSTLASSLDITPTIMGQLGGTYRSVFFGRDALSIAPSSGYALMQHNHDLALLQSNQQMLVLSSQKKYELFRLDTETYSLTQQQERNTRLRRDAISFFQSAHHLYYQERWFPAETSVSEQSHEIHHTHNIPIWQHNKPTTGRKF